MKTPAGRCERYRCQSKPEEGGYPVMLLQEPLMTIFASRAVGLHVGQRLVELAVQFSVVLAQAHAVFLGAEVVVEHFVL